MAQPLLFALIGAEVDFDSIRPSLVGKQQTLHYKFDMKVEPQLIVVFLYGVDPFWT